MITTANETMITPTDDARLHRDHRRGERAAERGEEDADRERQPCRRASTLTPMLARDLGAVDHRQHDLALARAVEAPPDGEAETTASATSAKS